MASNSAALHSHYLEHSPQFFRFSRKRLLPYPGCGVAFRLSKVVSCLFPQRIKMKSCKQRIGYGMILTVGHREASSRPPKNFVISIV